MISSFRDIFFSIRYKAILGLDHRYNNSYNYQLPILIPSEIGIGHFNSPVWFRHFIAHTLERAAQGFGVYCYGEVRKELPELGDVRNELIRMLKNISLNEDIIWEGLPGPGAVSDSYMNYYTCDLTPE